MTRTFPNSSGDMVSPNRVSMWRYNPNPAPKATKADGTIQDKETSRTSHTALSFLLPHGIWRYISQWHCQSLNRVLSGRPPPMRPTNTIRIHFVPSYAAYRECTITLLYYLILWIYRIRQLPPQLVNSHGIDCIYYFVLIGIGLGSKSFWAINQGISFRHRGIQAQQINIVNIGKIPPQKY